MSLPQFSRQTSLFSVNALLGNQFAADDRYRLFAERIHPLLVAARPQMEAAYCLDNGLTEGDANLYLIFFHLHASCSSQWAGRPAGQKRI